MIAGLFGDGLQKLVDATLAGRQMNASRQFFGRKGLGETDMGHR